MKKSTSILLKTTAILSLVISIFFFFEGVSLIFNLFGFKDLYIEVIKNMGMITSASEINFQVYMGIFDALIGLFLNSYCAGNYYRLSKSKNILLGSSKVLLYMGILQCFFIVSILPGILAIITSVKISKEEKEIINRPRNEQNQSTELDQMSIQIVSIKQQLEKGEITQEQYDRALNNIIENSAKNKIFSHQPIQNNSNTNSQNKEKSDQ